MGIKRLIMYFFFLIPLSGFSQAVESDSIYKDPEQMPVFIGGEEAYYKFIMNNLRYPAKAVEKGEEGEVEIQFVVTKDGIIKNVEVIRGISNELNKEAERLILAMPKWKPGRNGKGERINVLVTKTMKFKIH